MPRIRSVLIRVEIDRAQRAHDCQANARHRIGRGDIRLKVRNGRSWDHYCPTCAQTILSRAIGSLQGVQAGLVAGQPVTAGEAES